MGRMSDDMGDDMGEDVGQSGLRIDAIHLGGNDQARIDSVSIPTNI